MGYKQWVLVEICHPVSSFYKYDNKFWKGLFNRTPTKFLDGCLNATLCSSLAFGVGMEANDKMELNEADWNEKAVVSVSPNNCCKVLVAIVIIWDY